MLTPAIVLLGLACSGREGPPSEPPAPLEPPRLEFVTATSALAGSLPDGPLRHIALVSDARSDRVVAFGAASTGSGSHSIFRLGEGSLAEPVWDTSPRRILDTGHLVRFAVADLNGDGQAELIVRAFEGVYAMGLEGRVRLLADLTFAEPVGASELDIEEGVVHGSGPATFWIAGSGGAPADLVSRVLLRHEFCGTDDCFAELPYVGQVLHQDGLNLSVYGQVSFGEHGRSFSLAVARCELDVSALRYRCEDLVALWRPGSYIVRRIAAFAHCKGPEFQVFLGQDPIGRGDTFGWVVRGVGTVADGAFAVPAVDRAAPISGWRAACDEDSTSLDVVATDDLGLSWHATRCVGERCAHVRGPIEPSEDASFAFLTSDVPGYAEVRDGQVTLHRWVDTREL